MTTTETPEPFRIPIATSVRYVARGLPDVPNAYGRGVLKPSEITLTYRAAPDSQLGRVHAYVAGRLWADGTEIPLLPGGLYGQHYDDGLEGWPDWLAEEARLHDPAAAPVPPPADHTPSRSRIARFLDAVTHSGPGYDVHEPADPPPSADRATVLREAELLREAIARVEDLEERAKTTVGLGLGWESARDVLRRMLDEADGSRLAAEQPTETQDTLPAWLAHRFDPRGADWDGMSDDDRSYWEHHAQAVRRAVERGGFKPTAERPAVVEQPDTQTREA